MRAMPGGATRAAAPDIALARLLHAMPVRHAGHPPRQATPPASVQDWSHGRAGSACPPTHRDPCCPRVRAPAVQSIPPGVDYSTPSRRTRTKRDPPLFRLPNHITRALGGHARAAPRAEPMWPTPPRNRVPRRTPSRVQTPWAARIKYRPIIKLTRLEPERCVIGWSKQTTPLLQPAGLRCTRSKRRVSVAMHARTDDDGGGLTRLSG